MLNWGGLPLSLAYLPLSDTCTDKGDRKAPQGVIIKDTQDIQNKPPKTINNLSQMNLKSIKIGPWDPMVTQGDP